MLGIQHLFNYSEIIIILISFKTCVPQDPRIFTSLPQKLCRAQWLQTEYGNERPVIWTLYTQLISHKSPYLRSSEQIMSFISKDTEIQGSYCKIGLGGDTSLFHFISYHLFFRIKPSVVQTRRSIGSTPAVLIVSPISLILMAKARTHSFTTPAPNQDR